MTIGLVEFSTILLLMRSYDVLVSVWMGIRGCRWPSSLSVLSMGTAVLVFKNNAPSSASAVDEITLRIIVDRLRMAPLFGGFYSSFDRKWWPPPLMRALFLDR